MAEKRMFSNKIIDSDAFIDMPLSTQALYFHLHMRADDDGFLNNAQRIMRMIGANKNDYDLLVAKSFIIQFPDGICVIKHWRIHNYIRKDRYRGTQYTEEKAMLSIKENGSYTLAQNAHVGIPSDNQMVDERVTQIRLDQNSIDLDNINKVQKEDFAPTENKKEKTNKQEIEAFFESIWKLYPIKKGKQRVSDKQKQILFSIGLEELERAIKRYISDWEIEKDWRKQQNGSTFFNSGYVDYLDNNYVPPKQQQQNNNKFHNFDQRTYDYGALEEAFINKANGIGGNEMGKAW